jgi:hypothetical protein
VSGGTRAAATAPGERETGVPRGLVGAVALGMLLLGWVLRHYGLDLIDEGTLLAQTERVRTGEWPYRDFHTGYGPATFVLNAGLLTVFGVRLEVVRVGLAVTHAVGLTALAVLATRALGVFPAAAVLALTVSFFLPIAPGAFCVWNIPYPSWYAQALGGVALLAALAAPQRGARALVTSGAVWGMAFCFKQNTGVLGLAGVLVWRAFERANVREQRGSRTIGRVLALAIAGGVFLVVAGGSLGATGTVALALPALALATGVARLRVGAPFLGDAAWLGTGFALVVVPMVAITGAVAGWTSMARQLLHLGSGAAAVYGMAYPGPGDLGAALALGLSSGWRGVRRAMDLGWLFVLPLGQLIAAFQLRPGTGTRAWRLVVPAAILSYVQLFPRADFWHLLPVAGLSLVVAVGTATQALARIGDSRSRARSLLLGALVVLAAVRWVPNVAVLRAAFTAPPPGPQLARAAVRWDLAASPALRAVPEVVEALAGAPQAIGFPALAVFNFLSGVPNPLRHDYFFPGLLADPEERAIAEALTRLPDARVVVLRDPLAFFPAAFASHAPIAAAIERDFPRVREVGPYEVREAAR